MKATSQCPYCKADVQRPSQKLDSGYNTPTTFACGTSASVHWSPPVAGRQCPAFTIKAIPGHCVQPYPHNGTVSAAQK